MPDLPYRDEPDPERVTHLIAPPSQIRGIPLSNNDDFSALTVQDGQFSTEDLADRANPRCY